MTTTAHTTSVLVSGGSIAGTALAYWLDRYGFDVTVVELAGELRRGGQAVDVRGPALEVAARMGVLDELDAKRVVSRGMSMVDDDGNEIYRSEEHTLTGGAIGSPDIEVLREDIAYTLAAAAGDRIEYLFGDTITSIEDGDDGAVVSFRHGPARTFDLVVGADGLHSNTRRLVWGDEKPYTTHLGTYLGVWTTPNFLGLDHWQIFHQMPGDAWGGGIMAVRDNTECRAYFGFESPEPVEYDHRDTTAQKRLLAERLAGGQWVLPQVLEHMWSAEDFHFAPMAQVHLPSWSKGRVALVGDAGYCGSPLSGQGTSMAMVGAYVLAGELAAAAGDHERAYAAYERELRDYVTANQGLALTNKARVEAQQSGEADDEGVATDDDFRRVVESYGLKEYGA